MKRCAVFIFCLMNAGFIFAQNQLSDNLQQSFQKYQTENPQEKLFVHTDKTFYLAGETIWFKVYSVDASFHKPFSISHIAYIEILNKDQKSLVQGKVYMNGGVGNGSLSLPGFLPSGNYLFRAYTSWMKNFPADFYYEEFIHIVNTLKTTVNNTTVMRQATIQFFPEGGNLVSGLPGKIAFKALDSNNRGLDCQGAIINQRNDTIVRFQSLHNGMGSFQMTPEKDLNYFAILRLNDSLIKQKLPEASDHGFVMNIAGEEAGKIAISVKASPDMNNTDVYLFTQTRQSIKNVQVNKITDGEASFIVYKKDLGDGISHITLFNHLRQPVCERLVFKRPQETLSIQAKTDQANYNTRNPVKIDLSVTRSDQMSSSGNFSLSVFRIDSLQPVPQQDIVSYLYLGSDLRGHIESSGYYFANSDKATDEALDNLLLTQGWSRFKWDDVFENKKPSFEFLPEIEGPVVNGKIINKLTGSPVSESGAYLSIPGADYAFSSATSSSDGTIRFAFKDIYKNNVSIVQPALQKDSNYRIDITNAWSDKFSGTFLPAFSISKNQENILLDRSIGNQVENTYAVDKKRRFQKISLDTTSFFGKPDRTYNLDDYTHFQTMEEVLREYVDDVRLRKEGDKFNFKVRNKLFQTYFEESPLILLDGVFVSDASKIVALDPAKVRKIEVVTHRYFIGSSVFEGIVNIMSYTGDLGAAQIDPNSLAVEYEGIQRQREFYSPAYSTGEEQESHLPDFRNVLYWAPQVTPGLDGKTQLSFYTSDIKGKFVVMVQGLFDDGIPAKAVTFFSVSGYR